MHDVGGGGLATALAEMVAVTGLGLVVEEPVEHAELFSEFPGRFVVATGDLAAIAARCSLAGVALTPLGIVGGDRLQVGEVDVAVIDLERRRAGALEEALAAVS